MSFICYLVVDKCEKCEVYKKSVFLFSALRIRKQLSDCHPDWIHMILSEKLTLRRLLPLSKATVHDPQRRSQNTGGRR